MSNQKYISLALLVIIALFAAQSNAQSNADEGCTVSEEDLYGQPFIVDSRVYVGNDREPAVQTTTVFHGRKAYDRLRGALGSSTQFDFEQQLVSLVDERQEVFAIISFREILKFQAELRARAQKRDGLGAFLANPTFVYELDATSSTIKLSSPWLTYEATGRQTSSDVVERFAEFADWSSRLASMLNSSAPPAGARLELNSALRKQNWQVTQVTRRGGPKALQSGLLRSEHDYRDELAEQDIRLMKEVEKNLEKFREISFSEFHRLQNSGSVGVKK